MNKVPFLDLKREYQQLGKELESKLLEIARSQRYILGPELEAFEKEMASYLGVKYAIGLASGTDALILTLKALGIGPGDEVITTDYSFFSSAGAIVWVGARPVFVDIEPGGFNLDPREIEKKITERTKAILVVHLFGESAEMDEIIKVAKKHKLFILEDACQAIGAEYKGKKAGTLGDLGCYSFYPTKVLGGFGDGGLVVTDYPAFYQAVLELRVHGATGYGDRKTIGINSRLDEIQAGLLRIKLKYLDQWISQRRKKADRYRELLGGLPLMLPEDKTYLKHSYNSFVVLAEKRDELTEFLKKKEIGFAIYYPRAFHQFSCFQGFISKQDYFPNAEKASRKCLALPIFAELTEPEQELVAKTIKKFYG